MWIRNKRTGEYECLSPAVAKHKIHHDNTKSWEDTQSQHCSCGAVNHREMEMKKDLKQYITNLLYTAHSDDEMTPEEFDKWAESQVSNIDDYFSSETKNKTGCPKCGCDIVLSHKFDKSFKICFRCGNEWKD